MTDIRISPGMQKGALLAALGLVVAGVASQLPELRRYLKIELM
jgi:hypothetical protein